jgi:hypothetical protein
MTMVVADICSDLASAAMGRMLRREKSACTSVLAEFGGLGSGAQGVARSATAGRCRRHSARAT